jgi:hypothetical protein
LAPPFSLWLATGIGGLGVSLARIRLLKKPGNSAQNEAMNDGDVSTTTKAGQ